MALSFTDGSGANGGILTPQPSPIATTTNYADIVELGSDKLLSDYYNNLVERFGNQSIQGFLAKTSAEFPLKSDTVEWHEEGRLHVYYEGVQCTTKASGLFTFVSGSTGSVNPAIRTGQVVLVGDDSGNEYVGYVSAVVAAVSGTSDATITLESYNSDEFDSFTDETGETGTHTVRVIGSEFEKGSSGMTGSVETETTNFSNNPVIMKDQYSVSGSDTAQIGWIKVEGGQEDSAFGADGWLWYLKSEMDNRERFMDYLETYMLEAIPANSATDANGEGLQGTDGVFYRLEQDGIVATGGFADNTFSAFTADVDGLLKELDKQGNVQENLLYLNRDESLAIDNGLALANGAFSGGSYFGAFNNMKDMALNLGFKSWHRGSYTFHKTDWKYLNDATGRSNYGNGTLNNILGLMTPSGSMSVYDKSLGGTAKRPYIHIRYRASQTDNRKFKHWITGSVGGVYTNNEDRMDVHYLSERCTVIQGANNFAIFKRA